MNARTAFDSLTMRDVPASFVAMLTPKPAHTADTYPSDYQVAFEEQRRYFLARMDGDDITSQIDGDDADAIVKLIQAGNPNAVGRKMIELMGAWADNLAHRTVEVDQQVAS